MSTIALLIISLVWSFVGILVKAASLAVSSWIITFCRFFFGAAILGIILYVRDKKLKVEWKHKWIWIGVIGKSFNYILENIAIGMGYSYGFIIGMPVQTLFMVLVSTLVFKEKIPAKNWPAIFMCFGGLLLVIWNGMSWSELLNTNLITTVLFILSSIGVCFHFLSQKILIKEMDSGSMNFSVFLLCSLVTAAPLPFDFQIKGNFSILSMLTLISLGLITGITFYLYAKVLKNVSLLVATVITNSSLMFSLLWAWLFFSEPITWYIISGALIFLVGVIIITLPKEALSIKRLQNESGTDG